MDLIYGGAYQGKLEYAKGEFNIADKDVFYCKQDKAEIDLTKKLIYGFHEYAMACVKEGIEAGDIIDKLKDKIVISNDVSCGIVPMDKDERAMREMVGRALIKIASESNSVVRVFCGIPQKLK
ncbi:MAG: bifunctional adenosylcobinamide kinase/adenosylcobinamide-phosphate guanylyltransferase [Anaerovoracaceae bacterium]